MIPCKTAMLAVLTTVCASLVVGVAPTQALVALPPAVDDVLDRPMRGQAAVDALSDRLPEVAAENRLKASQLTAFLQNDRTLWLDEAGKLHAKDEFIPTAAPEGTTEEAPFPNAVTFELHSNPGAPRTIYLDFDGHAVTGTGWNTSYGVATSTQPAFDLDGNPGAWSDSEHDAIQRVYQLVAEDFAPFNVDVTTQDPGDAALVRSSSDDQTYGTRVLITPSAEAHDKMCGGCGGIAYIGVFNSTNAGYYQPAWVFPHKLSNNAKYIAEAVSHEAGHNLGLRHDGTASVTYYSGHGNWAPIMGVGYYQPLTQWSQGEYPGANNTQQDFAVAQSYGLPLLADDNGSSAATARDLTNIPLTTGVNETAADVDFFRFERSCDAGATVELTPAQSYPNLDAKLTLRDAGGDLIAVSDPASGASSYEVATGLSASISAPLAPGVYFVEVNGVGARDLTTGYSDYGSVGPYTLTISQCPTSSTPSAPTHVSTAVGSASSATLTWEPPASDGGSAITGYRVAHDGGSLGGGWSATVAASARSQTFLNLRAGDTYNLSVSAINVQGMGPAVTLPVTMPAAAVPSAPTSVTAAVVSGSSATLRWSPPTSSGGSAITGYRVAHDGGSLGGGWSATVAASARSQTFLNLRAGDTYNLSVSAINAQGTGPAVTLPVTMPAAAVPSAPTSVTAAVVSGSSATLRWSPPTSSGGSAITGYRVSHDGGSLGAGWSATVAASARSQTFLNLRAGDTYNLSVSAINAQGTGPAVMVPVTMPTATVPGAPRIGTAAAGVAGGAITARAAWNPPTATGGSAITGYRVRALRMSSTGTVLSTTISSLQAASARTLTMTLPQTGNYRFTVQAVNAIGDGALSARSNLVAGR